MMFWVQILLFTNIHKYSDQKWFSFYLYLQEIRLQ